MIVRYLRSRVIVLASIIALVLGQRCATERPPPRELNAVAAFFAHALAQEQSSSEGPAVDPTSIHWEPAPNLLSAALVGRRALFLAATSPGGAHDVYRIRARISPEGHVLAVNQWRNLTKTSLGDEASLAVTDNMAVFSHQAYGKLQGLSALELQGGFLNGARERQDFATMPGRWFNHLLRAGRAFQQTGSWHGIGRVHVELSGPGPVDVRFSEQRLVISEREGVHSASIELDRAMVSPSNQLVRRVSRQPYASNYWPQTVVDVLHDLSGVEPRLWFDQHVRPLLEDWRQTKPLAQVATSRIAAVDTAPTSQTDSSLSPWPPPAIPVRFEPKLEGEGQWRPAGFGKGVQTEFEQAMGPGAAFAKAWFRPDPQRPQTRLHLVAMDMRRLSIGVEAGYDRPRPQIGPPASGMLPSGELRSQVTAVFNAGTGDAYDAFGLMTEQRLVVPPKPGVATLVVRTDGWVGFGTWPNERESGSSHFGLSPGGIRSFRQLPNLVLSDAGIDVARQQSTTGQPPDAVRTERSALCRTETGQLYYAWGLDLTRYALALGLHTAGCRNALDLGAHPGRGGMAFTRVSPQTDSMTSEERPVHPKMQLRASEMVSRSPEAFFYVTQSEPGQGMSSRASELTWTPSAGDQPAPSEWPALWESSITLGALPVRVLRVDPGRLRYALTASTLEPLLQGRPTPRRRLPESMRHQPLLAVSLGHTTARLGYGLAFGRRVTLPSRRKYGTLVVSAEGMLDVLPSGQRYAAEPGEVVVQLPQLVADGLVVRDATERGRQSTRGAICVHDARLWIATGEHDSSDAVAVTLRDLGCDTVLELDRGSRHPVAVQRDNLSELAATQSERTWLWGVGMGMQPRTFKF